MTGACCVQNLIAPAKKITPKSERSTLCPGWLKSAKHFAKVSLVLSVHRKYSTLL